MYGLSGRRSLHFALLEHHEPSRDRDADCDRETYG